MSRAPAIKVVVLLLPASFLLAGCDGSLPDDSLDTAPGTAVSTPPVNVQHDILYVLVEEEVKSNATNERSAHLNPIRYVWVSLTWDEYEELSEEERARCTDDPWANKPSSLTGDAIPLPELGLFAPASQCSARYSLCPR